MKILLRTLFATILIFLEIGFVFGQNAIGFRWVKAPIQGYSFQYPLASKSGRLYSIGYEKISRYDSIGNIYQIFPLPQSSTYEPVRFEVTKNESFLVRRQTPSPFCGVGGWTTETREDFLSSGSSLNYMHYIFSSSGIGPGFGTSYNYESGEMFEKSLISENDFLFSYVSSETFLRNSKPDFDVHTFQLADTNLNILWRKKIKAKPYEGILFETTKDDRFLITIQTDSNIVVDSTTQVLVSEKSFVHLYFNKNGSLVKTHVVPDQFIISDKFSTINYKLRPNQSLFKLTSKRDSNWIWHSSSLKYIDSLGSLKWEKHFTSNNRFSNLLEICPDDSGNVLCSFGYFKVPGQISISFLVLTKNGQVLWSDSSKQKIYYDGSNNSIQNIGVLNWAVSLVAADSITLGSFSKSLTEYERSFIANIREIQPFTLIPSVPKFCTSDLAKISILNNRISGIAGVDTFYVYLSDSLGNFANSILLTKSTSTEPEFAFPQNLAPGDLYRFRIYSSLHHRFGPLSEPLVIRPLPTKPIISSATGSFSTCMNKPLVLSTSRTSADFLWSTGSKEASTFARPNSFHFVTATIGGCQIKSDSVFVNGIRDQVDIQFSKIFCSASQPVALLVQPDSGHWSGPQLDSTKKFFIPQQVNDTVNLRYLDSSNAQCPIDTTIHIYQYLRPASTILPDTQFCQQNRKIKLPTFPNSKYNYWFESWSFKGDSLWLGQEGQFLLTCDIGPYSCTSKQYLNVKVLSSAESPCFGLDSLANYAFQVQQKNCLPTEYFTQIKVGNSNINNQTRFEIQLSDSTGNFGNPMVVARGNNALLKLQFPTNIPRGNQYRIRLRRFSPDSVFEALPDLLSFIKRPETPVIKSIGPLIRCFPNNDNPTRLYVDNGFSTTWFPGGESVDTITPTAGVYYYVQSGEPGCLSNESHYVRITNLKPALVQLTSAKEICVPANPFILQVNNWSPNPKWTGPQVDSLNGRFTPGNQEDTVLVRYRNYVNGNACLTDTTFKIYQKIKPQLPPTSNQTVCQNAGILTLPFENQNVFWCGVGVSNQNKFNPHRSTGQYTINGVGVNGFCRTNTKLYITVRDSLLANCLFTQVGEIESESNTEIFPNPAEDEIQISTSLAIQHVSIFDPLGKVLLEVPFQKLENPKIGHSLNISGLKPGLYILRMKTQKGDLVKKFIRK